MSYDATASVAMQKGSYVKLCTAAMPVPTLNSRPLDGDWFQSIRDKLHWNVRTLQKPLAAGFTVKEWADDPVCFTDSLARSLASSTPLKPVAAVKPETGVEQHEIDDDCSDVDADAQQPAGKIGSG